MEKEYLLREKPLKALWLFALPMMVGNLFQQFYTMADSMIVGVSWGKTALAAIGASYALTNVFICIAIGGGVGAGVLTGRYFGAREYLRLRLCIRTALHDLSGLKPAAFRFRSFVLQCHSSCFAYAGKCAADGFCLSDDLFSGLALSLPLQCAFRYVQRPGTLPGAAVSVDLFFDD